MKKRRKPWIAFLLCQICPGMGQLYNGDVTWTVIAFVVSVVGMLLSSVYLFDTLGKLGAAIALGFVIDTAFSIQAYLKAKQIGEMELKRWQRWWVYILFCVFLYGFPDGYGTLIPSRILSFQIPSESMVPNLLKGDRLVADGWSVWRKTPGRGEIVVFDYPGPPLPSIEDSGGGQVKFVKRLIGLPGDQIELKEGRLIVNGRMLPQERSEAARAQDGDHGMGYEEELDGHKYIIRRSFPAVKETFGPITVPADSFFMMGDNRDRSNDSRFWGFVPRKNLVGRMRYIYFSWDSDQPQIRWERIGRQVDN
jgi:signal peptidase I